MRPAVIAASQLQDLARARLADANALQDQYKRPGGGILADDLAQAIVEAAALNTTAGHVGGAKTRREGLVTAALQSTNSTSFTVLGTPDRATITVPASALLLVAYRARVNCSAGTGSAALFVNGIQLKAPASGGSAGQQADFTNSVQRRLLYSDSSGLQFTVDPSGETYGDQTPSSVGGVTFAPQFGRDLWIPVLVAAGTYDVEVRFKNSAGANTTEAEDRRLIALARSFA